MLNSIIYFLQLVFLLLCGLVILVILGQNLQIYPEVMRSWSKKKGVRNPETLPPATESFFIRDSRGTLLEAWYLPAAVPSNKIGFVFHGNGHTLDNAEHFQSWFRDVGISSYSIDYPGYGASEGFPTEKGIYSAATALLDFVSSRHNLSESQVVVLGQSLGSAPASFVSAKIDADVLILLSGFTSIPDAVRARPFVKYLAAFLWNELPTAKFVSSLRKTSLVLAHGTDDEVIPFSHMQGLKNSYRGTGNVFAIESEVADHNNVFSMVLHQLSDKLRICLENPGKDPLRSAK